MVASVRRERRIASAAAKQITTHECEVARLDRDVGTGSDRDAQVGLRERSGVVHTVTDHGDNVAVGLQAPDGVDLAGGEDLRDERPDADLLGDRARARSLSPVSSTGVRPSGRNRPIASPLVGFTVSATIGARRAAPSQAASTTVSALRRPAPLGVPPPVRLHVMASP